MKALELVKVGVKTGGHYWFMDSAEPPCFLNSIRYKTAYDAVYALLRNEIEWDVGHLVKWGKSPETE